MPSPVTPEPGEPGAPGDSPPPAPSEQQLVDRARMRTVVVAVVGLAIGVLTSFGRTHLVGALQPLVNSASAWLVPGFVLGALMRTRRGAAGAGLACALLQLAGYYATARLRGYATDDSLVAFWAICAAVGGPLLGAAGHIARRERPAVRGLGCALLASAFITEGAWSYLHERHDTGSGAVWIGIGLAICAAFLRSVGRIRWLALTIPLALVGEILLSRIYR